MHKISFQIIISNNLLQFYFFLFYNYYFVKLYTTKELILIHIKKLSFRFHRNYFNNFISIIYLLIYSKHILSYPFYDVRTINHG